MVNKLHLIYLMVIAAIILLAVIICWILSTNSIITENAMQNFSFAATIASIVLAVVSITFTIYSGAGMTGSVGLMQNAGKKIEEQVNRIQDIDTRVFHAVEDGNQSLLGKVDELSKLIEPSNTSIHNTSTDNGLFDLNRTSIYGLYALYISSLCSKKKIEWPLDILGEESKQYMQGFLVAIVSVPSLKFYYKSNDEFSIIESCEFGDGGLVIKDEEIIKQLEKKTKKDTGYNDTINIIHKHFHIV